MARQWDDTKYHHVPGVHPPPSATNASTPNVTVHVSGTRPKERQYENRQRDENENDNNYQEVRSKRDQRLQRLQERGTQRGLRGAPEPDVVFLYITSCDIKTTAEEMELHILEQYENVTEARARSTARSHNYYASFTVRVKGNDLDTDDFLNSEAFPKPIKVFLNRNKYPDQEDV